MFNELKTRGVQDGFIAGVDGLKGWPQAIETVYRHTQVQWCVMHPVRNRLRDVPWKDRKRVAADLRAIDTAPTVEAARVALGAFAEPWDRPYPAIAPGWEWNGERLTPFFGYPPESRKGSTPPHAIELLNDSLRKIIKGRGAFPHDDAIRKLWYFGLKNASKKWTMPVRGLHPRRCPYRLCGEGSTGIA